MTGGVDVAATCQIEVAYGSGYHFRKCGKPVKRDGMCGIHAAAKERRERNDAARLAQARRRTALAAEKAAEHQALLDALATAERRLAAVEALADGWDAIDEEDEWHAADLWHDATDRLRAALGAGEAEGVGRP